MNKISKIQLIIIFTFLLLCLIGFLIWNKKTKDLITQLNKEYPDLQLRDSLNSKVADIYVIPLFGFKSLPSFRRFTTTDNKKYAVYARSYTNPKTIFLEYELHAGDSIKKEAGSETIIVINSKGKFFFKLKKWY